MVSPSIAVLSGPTVELSGHIAIACFIPSEAVGSNKPWLVGDHRNAVHRSSDSSHHRLHQPWGGSDMIRSLPLTLDTERIGAVRPATAIESTGPNAVG